MNDEYLPGEFKDQIIWMIYRVDVRTEDKAGLWIGLASREA